MFKLLHNVLSNRYAIVLCCGLMLIAGSAYAGWQLGQSRSTGASGAAASLPKVKNATYPTPPGFQAYQPGKLYGLPDPIISQQTLETLRLKEKAHQLALADQAARVRTRNLVAPDRNNVNCARMKCIALTYDDGPHPRLSPKLLDVLHEREAVATFFVVGNKIEGKQDLLKRMVHEKNEIGNHSWSHANLKLLTDEQIVKQVKRTNKIIKNATGQRSRLMRPPYAKRDARVIEHIGMPIAFWNIDPEDWRAKNSQAIYRHVIAKAGPGDVIIMHDIKENTVEAAPLIIDELQSQGYVLVTMSELFGITDENLHDLHGKSLYHR